jgi:hypothetical protein
MMILLSLFSTQFLTSLQLANTFTLSSKYLEQHSYADPPFRTIDDAWATFLAYHVESQWVLSDSHVGSLVTRVLRGAGGKAVQVTRQNVRTVRRSAVLVVRF